MAKLTISDAARACHVARTTIQRAVKTGRLALDPDHCVDTAELLRVGYHLDAAVLHAASQQTSVAMQQDAAPQRSPTQQQGGAGQELQLLRQERDALQRERDLLMQQIDMLRSMHQTTQQQLTQAQQMLHEMQHRYDRLLDMPRQGVQDRPEAPQPPRRVPSPPPVPDVFLGAPPQAGGLTRRDPRGAMRQRIVARLQSHPEGLTSAQLQIALGVEQSLTDTCIGMCRDGLLRRVERGRYVAV